MVSAFEKKGDKYKLGIADKDGESVSLPKEEFTADELDDVVGKEVAEKIRNGEGKRYRGRGYHTLEGLDLKVGGEGMKGFYDKILPDFANKFGKKYGAKVGESFRAKRLRAAQPRNIWPILATRSTPSTSRQNSKTPPSTKASRSSRTSKTTTRGAQEVPSRLRRKAQ
jgi:hypothetical protein